MEFEISNELDESARDIAYSLLTDVEKQRIDKRAEVCKDRLQKAEEKNVISNTHRYLVIHFATQSVPESKEAYELYSGLKRSALLQEGKVQ